MTKLTEVEYTKLDKEGKCIKHDKKGVYLIDPYLKEMYGDEILICLCKNCLIDRIGNI